MNELIKKVTQFLPSFSFRLDGNKRLALLAAAAVAATAIIVSVLWNGNHGYVSLYGSQENIPVSQIVTVLDGEKLDLDQVNAIVHLVSGSVPDLKASQVSVVDQAGNLLSDGIGAGEAVSAATRKRDQILKDIQDKTRASLANVLDSLVGTGNYRVSVMPDLDLSNIDETQEHYGDTPKVNREETVLDSDTSQIAMGIPGSLSNRPPVAANQVTNGANGTAPEESNQPAALSKHSENKRDYSWDRSVEHIQHPGFDIKRLNVAVVLNQSAPALKNWKPEQTTQLTALLNNAAGIDARRGDNLSLSLLNFVPQSIPVEPVVPFWKDDDILAWVRLIGCGLLALLLLVFVVRPVMKRLTAERRRTSAPELALDAAPIAIPADKPHFAAAEDERKNIELPSFPGDDSLPSQSSGLEVKLEFLQKLAMSDTDRVAEVLRQWITSNERIDNK